MHASLHSVDLLKYRRLPILQRVSQLGLKIAVDLPFGFELSLDQLIGRLKLRLDCCHTALDSLQFLLQVIPLARTACLLNMQVMQFAILHLHRVAFTQRSFKLLARGHQLGLEMFLQFQKFGLFDLRVFLDLRKCPSELEVFGFELQYLDFLVSGLLWGEGSRSLGNG
jgi:hypothetical protein